MADTSTFERGKPFSRKMEAFAEQFSRLGETPNAPIAVDFKNYKACDVRFAALLPAERDFSSVGKGCKGLLPGEKISLAGFETAKYSRSGRLRAGGQKRPKGMIERII